MDYTGLPFVPFRCDVIHVGIVKRNKKVRKDGYRGEVPARLYTVAFFNGLRRADPASLRAEMFNRIDDRPMVAMVVGN